VTEIGFIGLGIMGDPMAAHLAKAGHQVTGYVRRPDAGRHLIEAGGTTVTTIADAVATAEVVITMLPSGAEVEDVVLGEHGVLANTAAGTLLIDMSTISPETAVHIAERHAHSLDAPVSGGQAGAENATLAIMVGGDTDDVEAARPLFDVLGTTIVHVGPPGAGQTVKAANQLVVGGIIALVSEAIVLLEAAGVDAGAGLDVLAGGLAASRVLDLKRESMLRREFTPGGRLELHHKDMGIALDAARRAGVALPVTGLVAQLMAAGRAMGFGGQDHTALLRVIEQLSGVRSGQ
jgi:2-hydroxy-3-oxopropionate reductase